MYERERIEQERSTWERKPQLRLLKADYSAQIVACLPAHQRSTPEGLPHGRCIELGAGCGGVKASIPGCIASDIFPTPWVDLVMTAEQLPLTDGSIDALIGVDVLHHMERPLDFFREAARVLRVGGKVILIDPYVSVGSWIPWHHIHHEACSMREPIDFSRRFGEENNARATLWFDRHLATMTTLIHPLQIEQIRHFDMFYYPLIGGFRWWSLIPRAAAPALLRVDRWLGQWLGRLLGYRILIVMTRGGA